ncbi:MAG: class I SAM-dependent methyltransferase [Gammaproteobacteria bacterium]|nr:class I SAM-dependent methyltransferase [Gammaproteobacteria bacterium]MBU0788302.1 class I SAM-dependent methyltransferase [Gammaproteobacteria bacterium]MBU0815201.1 class I SAM-dependent methyltransferase [Gammaproteobacteria bacterium]MBU1785691.1 class I SAM-dependent methyltransferase [Gammaproteobacteria bacterium]
MNGSGEPHCPVCGGETAHVLATELRRGRGRVLHCRVCDHGFLLQDQKVDSKQFYAEQYRQEYSHNAEEKATNARELFDVYKRYQQDRLDAIVPMLLPTTKLLEVGASAGQFLWHVKDRVRVVNAIELDKACRVFMEQKLHISADDEYLEYSRFARETYDVVCAFQVMEHVGDPFSFLKSLRAVTRSEGAIFVEVPNLHDPLLAIWNVPAYRGFYYHSAHLHYFSETSLRKVAQTAGFHDDQIEISFSQDYNLLNHLHWIMNNGPQTDCLVGLGEISFKGDNLEISQWLTQEINALNHRYIERLIAAKSTSNLMMKLKHV